MPLYPPRHARHAAVPPPVPSPYTSPPPARTGGRRPTLLLSGGAGVLGRALVDELAPHFELVCLRHRTPLGDPRVREVAADLRAPGLGMSSIERLRLAARVDVVLHSAAATNWRDDPREIIATNTVGTNAMLDLAARADAPFYYMSTAFAANPVSEEDQERFPGAAAYLTSKVEAEQLVRDSGLHTAILRPSVVMGDSRTGRIAGQQGLTKAIGSIALGQVPVLPGAADVRIDMVPQDFVARATHELIRSGVSGEYWLTAGGEALLLHEIVDLCREFAEWYGLPRPPRPRLIPVEAVHRLLLPMLDGTELPESKRKRFRYYSELLLVFQRELPFDSSMGMPGCGPRPTRQGIRSALFRNLEHWAEGQARLLARYRKDRTAPAGVAS